MTAADSDSLSLGRLKFKVVLCSYLCINMQGSKAKASLNGRPTLRRLHLRERPSLCGLAEEALFLCFPLSMYSAILQEA